MKSNDIFAKTYVPVDQTKPLHDTTYVKFNLSSKWWFISTGVLMGSGVYNISSPSGWVDMHVTVDATAFEPSFGSGVLLSWDIHFSEQNKKLFGNIERFSLQPDSSEGNIEWGIISAMIWTVSQRWIELTDESQASTLIPYRKNMTEFLRQLHIGWKDNTVLKETGKTKVDGYTAYTVWWNEDGLRKFVEHILKDAKNIWSPVSFSGQTIDEAIKWIIDSPVQWHLIIYGKDNVELRIDSITTKDSGVLSFIYNNKWIIMTVKDNNEKTVGTLEVKKKKNELEFALRIPNNNITVQWKTENNQETLYLSLITSDITLHTIVTGISRAVNEYVPAIISGSTSIKQILEWFAALGIWWWTTLSDSE